MNTFKIEERRGKFRIQIKHLDRYICYSRDIKTEKTGWLREKEIVTEKYKPKDSWALLVLDTSTLLPAPFQYIGCGYVSPRHNKDLEFDSYEDAEKYIKKHYGKVGVANIVEPEWKTA